MKAAEKIETTDLVVFTEDEQKALKDYTITPEEVAEKAKEYMALEVIADDSESYDKANAARLICVHTRTGVDKRRKKLNKDDQKRINDRNEAAKKLVAPLAPVEEHLERELQIEDGRKAEIKAKKAKEELERVQGIRAKIMGMQTLMLSLPLRPAKELNEILDQAIDQIPKGEDLQEFLPEAQDLRDKLIEEATKAIAAREKLDREEAERKAESEQLEAQRKAQEAEAAHLKAEREAAEAAKKVEEERVATERKKIEEERTALEREKKAADERRWRSRLEQLKGAGWNAQEAFDQDTDEPIISYGDLVSIPDAEFNKVAKAWNKIVEAREKAKAEAERIAAEQKTEAERKEREEFERQAKIHAEAEAKAKVEREEQERKDREAKAAKEEADRLAAEALEKARQEALRPDRDKIITWANGVLDLTSPELKDVKAQGIVSNAILEIYAIAHDVIEKAEAL